MNLEEIQRLAAEEKMEDLILHNARIEKIKRKVAGDHNAITPEMYSLIDHDLLINPSRGFDWNYKVDLEYEGFMEAILKDPFSNSKYVIGPYSLQPGDVLYCEGNPIPCKDLILIAYKKDSHSYEEEDYQEWIYKHLITGKTYWLGATITELEYLTYIGTFEINITDEQISNMGYLSFSNRYKQRQRLIKIANLL